MKSNLNYRSYRTGDEFHILALFQKSFGFMLSDQIWNWRFRDNPAGPGLIELGWDGDVLAGQYAVTPVASRIFGQDQITGLSGTTMTHPSYRGQGLFQVLARNTYNRMNQSGMNFVWGFPNAMIHRQRVTDLLWRDIYEIPTLRLSIADRKYVSSLNAKIEELNKFDERFDLLWDKMKDDSNIITIRNYKHLQWRYTKNPSEHYRILAYIDNGNILGYAVFKKYVDEFQIVDILTVRDVEVGLQIISGITEIAKHEEVLAISLWLNVTHPLHHALERLGFRNGIPIAYLGGLILTSGIFEDKIYDYRNWYLTMGDSDVF